MSVTNATSKLHHRNARQSNSHSLYQSNLLADHTKLLTDIKTNTGNINLNVDTLEVNTDGLEALQTTANTTLASILVDTDAADSSLNTIEAQSVLTASRLNNIQNKLNVNTDGTGDTLGQIANNILSKNTDAETHLGNIDTGIDVLEACVGSNKVNVNISSGSISLPSGASTAALQTDSNTKLDTLEASLTSIESKIDTLDAVQDNAEAHLGNIDTGIDVLEACVGSNKVNVNISSGSIALPSGASTSALQTTANSKLDTLEASLTSMEAKQDTQVTHLSEIEGAVETLEGCVSGSELQVDIVGGNITGYATSTLQTTANGKLDTLEASLTSIESKIDTLDAVQDNAEAHLGNIDTGIDVLEACVGSNKVNVNISSGNISGFATSTLQGTTNGKLDTLETSLTSMEGKLDTIDSVLDNIKVDTEAIETAVEALNARDSLTTTLIIDGQSVSSGGGTHTSSSFEVTNIPPSGKLNFLVRISGVSPADIGVAVQLSADDTNFFGADLSAITIGVATSGVGQFVSCNFIAKHIKVQLTNTNGSSAATCSVHMFN